MQVFPEVFQSQELDMVILQSSYKKNGDLDFKIKYKYDKDGNITELSSYKKNGDLGFKFKYKYDKDGNQTELIMIKNFLVELQYCL